MKILLVEPIYCEAIIALRSKFELFVEILPNKERLLEVIEDKDVVILKSRIELDKEAIFAAKHLKLVVMAGIGLDHICLDELKKRGIAWFNIPDLSARGVAELVLGLTLSLARKICLGDSLLRNNEFKLWKRPELMGFNLQDRLFGIVGYGKIGKEMASVAKCFGMKVQVYVRNSDHKTFEQNITPVTFQNLLKTSDVISIHVPLTDETKGMFSKPEFELMQETALLINTSRGGVVNEKDLYHALKSKIIGGAALDVFEQKKPDDSLFELDNIVVTPHIGAMTQETQEQIGLQIVKKIFEFFK
ncbi:D-3-phosphoglycerate dehydrogenase [Beggiatoa sp. PS]|nr:D-3-phosphoglycerate dehydrogenase [Beggiatoa sp. PS]